jgi:hypothetical protein
MTLRHSTLGALLFLTACARQAVVLPSADEPKKVAFIAVGDTGDVNDRQARVAQAMTQFCATHRCDFVVLLGDNFYPSGVTSPTDPKWKTHFEEPYAGLAVPFYPSLGNHDYGDEGSGKDLTRAQAQVAYTPHSTKWKMPSTRYHLPLGAVEIFAADTNIAMWGDDSAMRDEFLKWTSTSSAPWKIAFGHHPYLSNGPHRDAGNNEGVAGRGTKLKAFFDDVVCGKVDLYLAGHDHSQQWLVPTCKGTELIISGVGQSFSGVKDFHPVHFQKSALGFVYVEADAQKLTASFVDDKGQVEFNRTLTK